MGQTVGGDHLWRVNVYHMRERKNETSLGIASAKSYSEAWCSGWKGDASVSCSHTWIKQLDVSAPQVRARGEFRLFCTCWDKRQLLSCSGHWSLDVAARSVLMVLELCKCSAPSQGDTEDLWFAPGQKECAAWETCCAERRAGEELQRACAQEKHLQETEAVSFPYWEWI